MAREEKDLLLKDIFGRIPYGVKCSYLDIAYGNLESFAYDDKDVIFVIDGIGIYSEHIKPYLFHLSSMTEEQKREYNSLRDFVPTYHYEFGDIVENTELYDNWGSIDYLNANHFDYRGLIEKGLAIDATDKNIY